MSRLFVYYNARKLDKLPKMSDYGTYIKSAIKAVKKWGASPEKAWPYRQGKVNRKPSRKSYRTARRFRIVEYAKIGDKLSDMQECLAAGYPFAFGIPVYDSFMKVGKSGRAKIPKLSENMLGGHAMLCVGYSKPGKYFIVKNSWGRSYGKKGYVYIPFKYMAQANECWTINQINYGEESI
jgi:C1A family cysteine protease